MNRYLATNRRSDWVATLVMMVWIAVGIPSSEADPLDQDSIFQELAGDWEGRGELIDGEGKVIRVIEKWSGQRVASGGMEASGTREWGDEGTHEFAWRYLYNPTTELVECEMTMSTSEQPVRFEVQVNEVEKTITLRASLGEGDSEVRIENKIEAGKIVGEVKMKNAEGVMNLSGTIEHRRPEAWEKEE